MVIRFPLSALPIALDGSLPTRSHVAVNHHELPKAKDHSPRPSFLMDLAHLV